MGIARFSINRQALAGVVLILAALLTFNSVFSSCDFLAESLQADLDQSRAPSFQALYWTRRNENMLASLLSWLDQGERAFAAVGAGHVLGSQGLVSLLRANGCSVTQVE